MVKIMNSWHIKRNQPDVILPNLDNYLMVEDDLKSKGNDSFFYCPYFYIFVMILKDMW